jgi:hypothetical protein
MNQKPQKNKASSEIELTHALKNLAKEQELSYEQALQTFKVFALFQRNQVEEERNKTLKDIQETLSFINENVEILSENLDLEQALQFIFEFIGEAFFGIQPDEDLWDSEDGDEDEEEDEHHGHKHKEGESCESHSGASMKSPVKNIHELKKTLLGSGQENPGKKKNNPGSGKKK